VGAKEKSSYTAAFGGPHVVLRHQAESLPASRVNSVAVAVIVAPNPAKPFVAKSMTVFVEPSVKVAM
jgi:hypothetical protein